MERAPRNGHEDRGVSLQGEFPPDPLLFPAAGKILPRTIQEPPGKGVTAAPKIITQDPRMTAALNLARRVAAKDVTVIIQGETGTGKELVARLIHASSPRASWPFIGINCAAFPETLIESELFGNERGAFTGAAERRIGAFEAANRGTLLLDEISEMSPNAQAKLLRVLQERAVKRIGSTSPIAINVRVIATTNRQLRVEVAEHRFRLDLFYRLDVVTIELPPLRNRPEDIPLLAAHFLAKHRATLSCQAEEFSPEAIRQLQEHSWPGNVRELENVIQRAMIHCSGKAIGHYEILLEPIGTEPGPAESPIRKTGTVAEVEHDLIMSTLKRLNGNRTHAARALGVSVRTIRNRLREYGLSKPTKTPSNTEDGQRPPPS